MILQANRRGKYAFERRGQSLLFQRATFSRLRVIGIIVPNDWRPGQGYRDARVPNARRASRCLLASIESECGLVT